MSDETNQLRVRLVTPERTLFEHAAVTVELPAKNGYMEVLYGHAPLVAELTGIDIKDLLRTSPRKSRSNAKIPATHEC